MSVNLSSLPPAFAEEREFERLRENPQFYHLMREILVRRRDQRREQTENSAGEAAAVMRGRCQELTAIINDIFPERREAGAPPTRFTRSSEKEF